jgi:hypothetical protein
MTTPRLRAVLAAFPERYALPSRPSAAGPAVQDAYRQTQFLLDADLALFERSMNLQVEVVGANKKTRSPSGTAVLSFWSRVYSHLADVCTLLHTGSYASCPPLLRAACDCVAAQRSLAADDYVEYEEWFASAVAQDREHAALAIDLGRFRAGSVLAQDERLGTVYRLLSDLAMPHFGSTVLQTAPETSLQKLALAFGDNAFHLGWAELTAGWLLTLADAQIQTAVESGVIAVPDDARERYEAVAGDIAAALKNPRRCYVESAGDRFVIHNFRRSPSGAPKRVML